MNQDVESLRLKIFNLDQEVQSKLKEYRSLYADWIVYDTKLRDLNVQINSLYEEIQLLKQGQRALGDL